MLVYVICLLILGLPAMVMELSVGRAAQTSPLYMYEKLSGKRKWKIPGIVCLIGNIALIAFYSVVADRKSTRLNSSHIPLSRMPSSA